jgi:hypothetical protein
MAKAKKAANKAAPKKKKGKYDITVKAPEGMTFEQLLKLAVTTPPKRRNKLR